MILKDLTAQDLPTLNALVSESFGYTPPHSFFDDFPVWKSGEVIRLGFFDGTTLAAHVGIRFTNMRTNGGMKPVALIGAVVTHQSYRKRGLSTQLLNEALTKADQRGVEWTLLWGSEHEFYAKLGFHLHGEQYRVALADLSINPKSALNPVNEGMCDEIFQYMISTANGIQITENDRAWVFAQKTVKWFWTKSPFAFVGFERGLDMPHIIHEFGGSSAGLDALFAHVFSKDSQAQMILSKAQLNHFSLDADNMIYESLCLARPKNPLLKWNPEFWVQGLGAC